MPKRRGTLEIAREDWLEAWKIFRNGMQTGHICENEMRQIAQALKWCDLYFRECPEQISIVCKSCKKEQALERRRLKRAKVINIKGRR